MCSVNYWHSGSGYPRRRTAVDGGRQHGETATARDETTGGRARRRDGVGEEAENQLHLRAAVSSTPVLRRLPVHRRTPASQDRGRAWTDRDPGA